MKNYTDALMSLWNTDKLDFVYSGQTWQYMWQNSNPYFFNNMHMNWKDSDYYMAPMMSFDKHMPVEIASFINDDSWRPDKKPQTWSRPQGQTMLTLQMN